MIARTNIPQNVVLRTNAVTLSDATSVDAACAAMREHQASCILVTDSERRLCGIFTGRDALYRVLATKRDPGITSLGEVMTPNPRTMLPTITTTEALALMVAGGHRHVPIVSNEKIIGVATWGDFR